MGIKSYFGFASTSVHRDMPLGEAWNHGIELVSRQVSADETGHAVRAQLDNIKLSAGSHLGESGDIRENITQVVGIAGLGVAQAVAHEVSRSSALSQGLREGVEVSLNYTRERMNHLETQIDEVLTTHRDSINGLATSTNLRLREMESTPSILQTYKSALGDIQNNLSRQETFAADVRKDLKRMNTDVQQGQVSVKVHEIELRKIRDKVENLDQANKATSATAMQLAARLDETQSTLERFDARLRALENP